MGWVAEKINIRLEGKELRQGNMLEYLEATVIGDGKYEAEDSGGCECMDEGGESNGRQKDIEEIERERSDVVCNAGLPLVTILRRWH